MHDSAALDPESLLAQIVTTRAVRAYFEAFGTLDDLLSDDGSGLRADSVLAGDTRGVSPADLARISRRAVARLSARDQLLAGREVLRPSDWRVILYGVSGATTLRDALERCVDCFEAIDWRCGKMTLRIRGDVAEVELNALHEATSQTACLIDLFGVAEIHGLLRALIVDPLPLRRISLDHPQRIFAELGLPRLPVPLDLDAGRTSFTFAATYLDHPVMGSLQTLTNQVRKSFLFGDTEMAAAENDPLPRRIRRIAMEALRAARRLPSFDEVVAQVGGSAATLRRRLAQDATNYREIKDSCRRELALDLLSRSDLPIEDIASRLDYCDSDAFRRAFRDWLGMAPSEYRRHALARSE